MLTVTLNNDNNDSVTQQRLDGCDLIISWWAWQIQTFQLEVYTAFLHLIPPYHWRGGFSSHLRLIFLIRFHCHMELGMMKLPYPQWLWTWTMWKMKKTKNKPTIANNYHFTMPVNVVFHMDYVAWRPLPCHPFYSRLKREVVFVTTVNVLVITLCILISPHWS